MEITKNWLIENDACPDSIKAFKNQKETNSFKILNTLVKSESKKGLDWANWLLVHLMTEKQRIQYATFAARKALPVSEKEYPNDDRPRKAIEAAERYLEDPSEERRQEAEIAGGAAWAADWSANWAAAWATNWTDWAAAGDAVAAAYAACNAWAATDDETFKEIINFGIKLLKED